MQYTEFLTAAEAARYLRLSPSWLSKLRVWGNGPRFSKLGRRVVYAREELEAWARARVRASTSEGGHADAR